MNRSDKRKHNRKINTGIISIIICIAALGAMIYYSSTYLGTSSDDSTDDKPIKKFSDYYYYEKDNEVRYSDFRDENPSVRAGDVVWMVNVNLDEDDYDNTDIVGEPSDPLVLVNKHYMLPISYEPSDMKEVGNDQKLSPEAADAYIKLEGDAKKAGFPVRAQSGYRSYKTQSMIYENNKKNDPDEVDTYSARPGYSEHQTGLAIDVNTLSGQGLRDFIGTEEAKWVSKNAYKYGFIVRYTEKNSDVTRYMAEPWHLRYVGVKHATKIKEEKIESFEEYLVKYIYNTKE